MPRKTVFILGLFALSLAACVRGRVLLTGSAPSTPQPTAAPFTRTAAPTSVPTQPPIESVGGQTPEPTFDFPSYLLTQAYAAYTPAPSETPLAAPAVTATRVPDNLFIFTATPAPTSASTSVILIEPIQIPNAVNTADCKISRVGDCAPTMNAGVNLFFTWKFGVRGSESFSWGNAAVVVVRDGAQFRWTQVGNGLVKPPGIDQGWSLRVGQMAEFRAGLEKAQPGHYTARLLMCALSPIECNAGQGWQNVGGEAIDFVITP